MLRPTYKEFQAYAKTATLVPVAKSISADLLTPVSAFLSFAEKEPYSFLLESVEGGEKIGRYTFLGANPYMRLTSDDDGVVLHRGRKQERIAGDAMQVIRRLLKQHKPAEVPDLPPFTAGAVGFVSYDMVRRFERLPETAKKDVDVPECALMFFDRLLAFDHVRHQIHIIAAADVREENPRRAYDRALSDIESIEKKLAKGFKSPAFKAMGGKLKVQRPTPQKKFEQAVRRAKEY